MRALRADEVAPGTDAPEAGTPAGAIGWTPPETLADLPAMVARLRQAGCRVDLRMEARGRGPIGYDFDELTARESSITWCSCAGE